MANVILEHFWQPLWRKDYGDHTDCMIQWVCQWRRFTCSIYRWYYLRSFTEVLRSYNVLKFAKLLCLVLLDASFPPHILFQGLLDVGWSRLARGTTFGIFQYTIYNIYSIYYHNLSQFHINPLQNKNSKISRIQKLGKFLSVRLFGLVLDFD